MRKLNTNQLGVGAIEAVIFTLLIVAIALLGWKVYDDGKKPKQSANPSTTQTAAKTPSTKPTTTTPSPAISSTTLKVPELGVQIVNIPSTISDLTYGIASQTGTLFKTQADFSTKSLSSKDSNCSSGSVGRLFNAQGTYDSATDQGPFTFVKQFSGFWIAYKASGVPCSQDLSTMNLQASQGTAFGKVIADPSNLEAL